MVKYFPSKIGCVAVFTVLLASETDDEAEAILKIAARNVEHTNNQTAVHFLYRMRESHARHLTVGDA